MLPFDRSFIDPPHTQTQAIIAAAYDLTDREAPRFASKCIITSDGFITSSFTGRDGRHHTGAFVGSVDDLHSNVTHFINHFKLNDDQAADLRAKIKAWPSQDYRS